MHEIRKRRVVYTAGGGWLRGALERTVAVAANPVKTMPAPAPPSVPSACSPGEWRERGGPRRGGEDAGEGAPDVAGAVGVVLGLLDRKSSRKASGREKTWRPAAGRQGRELPFRRRRGEMGRGGG
jgi:hypothetical protein